VQHLEQEAKLAVGPGWTLPDLSGVLPGAQVVPLPPLHLEATYYDTAGLRLLKRHVTFRYRWEHEGASRRGGQPSVTGTWTVKLPSSVENAVLSRTEVTWDVPAQRTGDRSARPADSARSGGPARTPARRTSPAAKARGTMSRGVVKGNGSGGRSARGTAGHGARAAAPQPLKAAADLLSALALGEQLRPVAHITTQRQRSQLRTSDGRPLAEVAYDTVTGTVLTARTADLAATAATAASAARPAGRPAGAARTARAAGPGRWRASDPPVSFTEVEVELAEGSSLEVLDAITARLIDAGACPSGSKSKLMAVLQAYDLPQLADMRQGARAANRRAGRQRPQRNRGDRRSPTMSALIAQQARSCIEVLLDHDLPIKLEDPEPEHVHRSRVATRRLRSLMRAIGPLITEGEGGTFHALRSELGWLGAALGAARDSDVRMKELEDQCASLGEGDASGAKWVLAVASEDAGIAHRQLLEAMASDRYLACLRSLEDLGQRGVGEAPGSLGAGDGAAAGGVGGRGAADESVGDSAAAGGLGQPAAIGMPALGRQQWRLVNKAVKRFRTDSSDEALHKVRIQTKRFRYIAEAAVPVLPSAEDRRAATDTVKAATKLQDLLGAAHDAALNEQWLRDVPSRLGAAGGISGRDRQRALLAAAITVGELVAAVRTVQLERRAEWDKGWARLNDPKMLRWAVARHS